MVSSIWPFERAQRDHRIEQSGRADDLLDDQRRAALRGIEILHRLVVAAGFDAEFFQIRHAAFLARLHRDVGFVFRAGVEDFKRPGRGGNVEALAGHLHELLEAQRAVVQRAGQPEAVLHEHRLAALVALIHAADLRDGGVAFVDHQQEIAREEIQQRVRPRAGFAAGEMARVVLDALAETHLGHHFQIIFRAHPQPLRLQQLVLLLESRRSARRVPRGSRWPRASSCRRA